MVRVRGVMCDRRVDDVVSGGLRCLGWDRVVDNALGGEDLNAMR